MANVLIGKFGQSLNFDEQKLKGYSGDYEPIVFFKSIIDSNPQNTYYLIGKSNILKSGYDPSNVVYIFEKYDSKENTYNFFNSLVFLTEYLKDIQIDYGLIFGGAVARNNFLGLMKSGKGSYYAPLLFATNYVFPVIHTLNTLGIDYYYFACDVRHANPDFYELYNLPKRIFGNTSMKSKIKHIQSYDDYELTEQEFECEYFELDKLVLLTRDYDTFLANEYLLDQEKEKDLIVLCNQGHSSDLRIEYLKEYIEGIDHDLYGKWNKPEGLSIFNYHGMMDFKMLDENLIDYKYTLLVPLTTSWCTPKFYEMIFNNVIPFFHHKYDTDRMFDVPAFIRCASGEDFKAKIEFLEENPKIRIKILKHLRKRITEDMFKNYMSDKLMKTLKSDGYEA